MVQKYKDFWQPDNSPDHGVVGKRVINVEVKLNSNVRNISDFQTLKFKGLKLGLLLSDIWKSRLNSKS
jgi:hypothetical protein